MKYITDHTHQFRIYYEDTDFAGLVYHANYLKFAERARSELLIDYNLKQSDLNQEYGISFVMQKQEIEYKSSAKFEDLITVKTCVISLSAASINFTQYIYRDEELLVIIKSKVVCVNKQNKPTKLPKIIRDKLIIQNQFVS